MDSTSASLSSHSPSLRSFPLLTLAPLFVWTAGAEDEAVCGIVQRNGDIWPLHKKHNEALCKHAKRTVLLGRGRQLASVITGSSSGPPRVGRVLRMAMAERETKEDTNREHKCKWDRTRAARSRNSRVHMQLRPHENGNRQDKSRRDRTTNSRRV